MFNMIGIGERASSGIPDIYQVWENEGWDAPVVEESYNPDRTRLTLEFAQKQADKTNEQSKRIKRAKKLNIKNYFSPLKVDDVGICDICQKYWEETH